MKSILSLRVNNMDMKVKERREGKYSSVWQMVCLPVSLMRKDKQDRTAAVPDKRDAQRSVARRQVDGHYLCDRRRICDIVKAIWRDF